MGFESLRLSKPITPFTGKLEEKLAYEVN